MPAVQHKQKINNMKKVIVVLILIICSISFYGQGLNLSLIKKNIVFLGTIENNNPTIFATAFLLEIDGITHLLTAKHVVAKQVNGILTNEVDDSKLIAFLHDKKGSIIQRPVSEAKKMGAQWIFHDDSQVDIAIIPFPIDVKSDDIAAIPKNLFLPVEDLHETYDVIFISFQNQISQRNNLLPIFRDGMISIKNKDNTFYIDGSAFPGNSGSPVFLKPSLVRYNKEGGTTTTLGGDPLGGKFIGIVGEYETYQEVAISSQTKRPRIIFEENTGLTKIWTINYINEIINSDRFKKQIIKLKK